MTQPSKLSDYTVLSTLGKGTFGHVVKIQHNITKQIYCWKQINFSTFNESEKKLLVQEVNILRELQHEYIVKYTDRIIDKSNKNIYIIMEYCSNNDLSYHINDIRKNKLSLLPESYIWQILYQITSALHYCHTHTPVILHRDIKPHNCFLDQHKNIKLGDFGLARILSNESQYASTQVGMYNNSCCVNI